LELNQNPSLRKNWLQFGGRPVFLIMNYIDRKFMK